MHFHNVMNNWPNPIRFILICALIISVAIPALPSDVNEIYLVSILIVIPIIILVIILDIPEIPFLLFMHAGKFKDVLYVPGGVDLTLFFALLSLVGMFYSFFRGRIDRSWPPAKMIVPYCVLVGMATISMGYTLGPVYGIDKLFRFLSFTSFSFFAAFYLFRDEIRIKNFFFALVIFASVATIDAMSRGIEPHEVAFRGAFGKENPAYWSLSNLTGQSILILIYSVFSDSINKWLKIPMLMLIMLNVFGLLISGSRTEPVAVFGVILLSFLFLFGNGVIYLYRKKTIPREHIKMILGNIFILFLLLLFILWFQDYFTYFIRRIVFLGDDPLTWSNRGYYFKHAIDAFANYPFGLGFGGFPVYISEEDLIHGGGRFPHNMFLELGSELGWIGLVGITLLLYFSFVSGVRSLSLVEGGKFFIGVTLLSLFGFTFFAVMYNGDINDNRLLFSWVAALFGFEKISFTHRKT